MSSSAPVSGAEVLTIIGFTQPSACSTHCAAVAAALKPSQTSR